MPTTKIVVTLPGCASYDVRVGTSLIHTFGVRLRQVPQIQYARRLAVITDEHVAPLVLDKVKLVTKHQGFSVSEIILPAGESTRSPDVVTEIWSAFAQLGITASDGVLAIGGGVTADIAGFVASTYRGGIPWVFMPTTLHAAVDRSVSRQASINVPGAPDAAAVSTRPAYVSCDVGFLGTITPQAWADGAAGLVQAALVTDDDSVFWLSDHEEVLASPACAEENPDTLAEAIARAVVTKADLLAEDHAAVQPLAYGAMFAQALRDVPGAEEMSFGRALASGMRLAGELSVEIAGLDAGVLEAQNTLLDRAGLGREQLDAAVIQQAADALCASSQTCTAVLLSDVGQAVSAELPKSVLLDVWSRV